MAETDTKDRILDAAERLFAEQGFSTPSLRSITSEADVNLAAVHYHFGSKEALIEAVFSRRVSPINRERLQLLDDLEAGESAPAVEQIIESFLGPPLRMSREWRSGGTVMRMLGHALSQPDVQHILTSQFHGVFHRFVDALERALPEIPRAELTWRFMFMVGSMAYTMSLSHEFERLSGAACADSPAPSGVDVELTLARLVPFLVAGMSAPLSTPAEHR